MNPTFKNMSDSTTDPKLAVVLNQLEVITEQLNESKKEGKQYSTQINELNYKLERITTVLIGYSGDNGIKSRVTILEEKVNKIEPMLNIVAKTAIIAFPVILASFIAFVSYVVFGESF